MTKEEYISDFRSGNENWIGKLEELLENFDNEIVGLDWNHHPYCDDIEGFEIGVFGTIDEYGKMEEFFIQLEGSNYLSGQIGYIDDCLVLTWGIGNTLSSAESTVVMNARDEQKLMKKFNLI
jgi:hypothetical protein